MSIFSHITSTWQKFQKMLWSANSGGSTQTATEMSFSDWVEQYDAWDLQYHNTIYRTTTNGGLRADILQNVIGRTNYDDEELFGFYNPTKSIVDAYSGLFQGTWGRELRPADTIDGNPESEPVNQKILEPLRQIWTWSNLATLRQRLVHVCALNGMVGLRIDHDRQSEKVRISIDHPKSIVDWDEDAEGNVTDILLEYEAFDPAADLGENRTKVKYRQRITKTYLQQIVNDQAGERVDNPLGVCPYVLLRHQDTGAARGLPAHDGVEETIHLINWLMTRQNKAIDRNIFGAWWGTGGGPAPTELVLDGQKFIYTMTTSGDPDPKLEHISPKLDHQRTQDFWMSLIDLIRETYPELVLNYLKLRSGQSGESIAQLMKPAEARLRDVRTNYDHAMVRAMQIAMSYGVLNSLWDVGAGMGSVSVADRSYKEGFETFVFAERPVLPQSSSDLIAAAEAERKPRSLDIADAAAATNILSHRDQVMMIHHDEAMTDKTLDEMRTMDVEDQAKMMKATEPAVTPGDAQE